MDRRLLLSIVLTLWGASAPASPRSGGEVGPQHGAEVASAETVDAASVEAASDDAASDDAPERDSSKSAFGFPLRSSAFELTIVQGLHGAAQGLLLCEVAGCGAPLQAGASVVGAALGVGLTLWATRNGISEGTALIVASGPVWGVVTGALSAPVLTGGPVTPLSLSTSMGVGVLYGLGLSWLFDPGVEQVALANSGGLWALTVGHQVLQGLGSRPESFTYALTQLILVNAGLVGGGLLFDLVPLSREQLLLVDLAFVGGVVGGAGVASLLGAAPDSPAFGVTSAAIGLAAGITTAILMARDAEGTTEHASRRWSFAPLALEGGAGAQLVFRH